MFRGVRFLVFTLSVVSFVAAGSLTLTLSSSTRVLVWGILLAVAIGAATAIGAAYSVSIRKMLRAPVTHVDSGNA